MKSTITIRFTEPQIALAMRAYPNCNLDRLIELSFVFDEAGKIMDCTGTIKDGPNTQHDYAGRGLAYLYKTARRKVTARPITAAVEISKRQKTCQSFSVNILAGSQASLSGILRPSPTFAALPPGLSLPCSWARAPRTVDRHLLAPVGTLVLGCAAHGVQARRRYRS
jgi:hypothetical protein